MLFSVQKLKDSSLYRELKSIRQMGCFLEFEGKKYLNFSSNDYLGISMKLDWQTEFLESLLPDQFFLMSSVSSRLLTGNSEPFDELETYLAQLYEREACLLFNSGYHANVGILPAIAGKKDLMLADKLVHASIIDGLRLCNCKWMRFKHNDYEDLISLLEKYRNDYERIFIVTESIFSMDGDCADLIKLIQIKKKYDALLYVDEAHAVGIRGKKGLGLSEESGVIKDIDMIVCTLGKAIASEGAFIICDGELKEFLVNHARTLIFTTGMSPIQVRWTRFIFEKMITMERERLHLQDLSDSFRRALQDRRILGNTHIIPLLVGESTDCLRLSEKLKEKGIWAMAVRYPTVPVDKARIRFSLTAGFTKEQIKEAYEIVLEN